ncbi:hypothetical protein NLN85_23840 [Citrobacter portucalensis]|uniref:hypothetical protein n=1 Tax=Citrobacter portucalensis TaxID=1639133 RepID=UPI00226B67BD|nr:hypothetical protein [Citrobacter portucalensis]MCX8995480.1 hypothetical protein [Citrobacter portucalensis]
MTTALFVIQPVNKELAERRHLQGLKSPLRVDKLETHLFFVMTAEANKGVGK